MKTSDLHRAERVLRLMDADPQVMGTNIDAPSSKEDDRDRLIQNLFLKAAGAIPGA